MRQLKVNIPMLDMIKQVPTYAKFLKDLCTLKRGLNFYKKAFLTEQVSTIVQCKTPMKYKDPSKVQRPGLSYHLSEYRSNLCREGTIGLGVQCQPAALFSLQAAGLGRVETYYHYIIPSRQINKNSQRHR